MNLDVTMDFAQVATEIRTQRRSVGFDTYDITVKQIVDMVAEGQIHVAPDYQRHFVWDTSRQSALIESIFLGIPIPSLFMATNDDSTWEVIDGLQRITTLINFVRPKFRAKIADVSKETLKISKLEKLESLNGVSFDDMPDTLKLNFMTRPIRITVLNDLSDFRVRFDLFERLNTGGILLHQQEIRNCIYQGKFNDFIKKCAQDERLNILVKRSDSTGRGNLEELTLKFFAYFEDREKFDHSVKDFLNQYMDRKTKKFNNENELEKIYVQVLENLVKIFPAGVVRRGRPNTTPLVLFEAVTVGVADAIKESKKINLKNLTKIIDSEELKKSTTGATNSNVKLINRISIVYRAASG